MTAILPTASPRGFFVAGIGAGAGKASLAPALCLVFSVFLPWHEACAKIRRTKKQRVYLSGNALYLPGMRKTAIGVAFGVHLAGERRAG